MVRMSDSACGWSTPLKEQFLINLKVIEERIIKKMLRILRTFYSSSELLACSKVLRKKMKKNNSF